MAISRQGLARLLAGGGVVALLALPGIASAAPSSAATSPATLSAPISGALAANSGGSFSFAQFNYPGNGATVTLNLTVNNPLPLENGAAGFNVYQAGALIGTSSATAPNTASFALTNAAAGPVLVQVFDYDGSNGIDFTLSGQGLPAASAATGAATTTTSATTSASTGGSSSTLAIGGSDSGALEGNSGGGFKLYSMPYAGNNQAVSLSMTVAPSTEIGTGLVGFNVYDANGALVGSGQQTDPQTLGLVVSNANGGAYTIQVFNYDPNVTVNYTLSQATD